MKRQGKSGATQRSALRSAKAREIVALVEAISADFGVKNGVVLGGGIARMLAEAYGRNGKTPSWVREIVAHYDGKRRES